MGHDRHSPTRALSRQAFGERHALGVGGRDLSAEVSGRSTLQAMAALDADPGTELILVVSKPPASESISYRVLLPCTC